MAITVMAGQPAPDMESGPPSRAQPLWIKVAGLPKCRHGNQHIEGVQGRVESRVRARTAGTGWRGAMSPCLAWREVGPR